MIYTNDGFMRHHRHGIKTNKTIITAKPIYRQALWTLGIDNFTRKDPLFSQWESLSELQFVLLIPSISHLRGDQSPSRFPPLSKKSKIKYIIRFDSID